MKKYLLSFLIVVVFAGYILNQRGVSLASVFSEDDVHVVTPPSSLSATSPSPSSTPPPTNTGGNSTPTPTAKPSSTPSNAGPYKDGTYTSPVEDAYYGNVQIKVSVQNGHISDVSFLQYPSDRSTSRYINSQAMPYLIQETIQSQNSNVDIVSGATDTSYAFIQALKNIVSQAS